MGVALGVGTGIYSQAQVGVVELIFKNQQFTASSLQLFLIYRLYQVLLNPVVVLIEFGTKSVLGEDVHFFGAEAADQIQVVRRHVC